MQKNNRRLYVQILFACIFLSSLLIGCRQADKENETSENKAIQELVATFDIKKIDIESKSEITPEKIELSLEDNTTRYEYVDVKIIKDTLYMILGNGKETATTISTNICYKEMTLVTYNLVTKEFKTLIQSDGETSISFEYILNEILYLRKQTGNKGNEKLGLLEVNPETNQVTEKLATSDKYSDFLINGKDIFIQYNSMLTSHSSKEQIKQFDFLTMTEKETYEKNLVMKENADGINFEEDTTEFTRIKKRMNKLNNFYKYDYTSYQEKVLGGFVTWNMESGESSRNVETDSNSSQASQLLEKNRVIQLVDFYPEGRSEEDSPIHSLTMVDLITKEQYFLCWNIDITRTLLNAYQSNLVAPANDNSFILKEFNGNWSKYTLKDDKVVKEEIKNTEKYETTMAMNNGWFFLSDGEAILLIK